MSKADIALQKRLIGLDVMVRLDAEGEEFLRNIDAKEPDMVVRVLEFITQLREVLSKKGHPDPFALITVDNSGGWSLCVDQENPCEEAISGYFFIRSQEDSGSIIADQLRLMDLGIEFLKQDSEGNTERAYRALARFIELYTLGWAEGDARPDIERGQGTVKAASEGGKSKARSMKPRTQRILREIRNIIGDGHTDARAAEIAHQRGFGTSKGANVKLLGRHRKE